MTVPQRQPDSFSQNQNRKELSPAGLPSPFSGSSFDENMLSRARRRRTHLIDLRHFPIPQNIRRKRLHRRFHLRHSLPDDLGMKIRHIVALIRIRIKVVQLGLWQQQILQPFLRSGAEPAAVIARNMDLPLAPPCALQMDIVGIEQRLAIDPVRFSRPQLPDIQPVCALCGSSRSAQLRDGQASNRLRTIRGRAVSGRHPRNEWLANATFPRFAFASAQPARAAPGTTARYRSKTAPAYPPARRFPAALP